LGAFLFAASHTFYTAFWGRVLIGLGMASILMSSLKIFTLWFPSKQFATLMGILISVGTLGNILATSPLAYFTSEIGWRMIFGLTGGICLLLAAVAFWVLGRGKEKQEEPIPSVPVASPVGIFQSLRIVLGSLTFWQGSMAAFFRYGTFISLQGLWLGPYLINIKGYSPLKTGNILIFLALGVITGGPISGHLSDRAFLSRRDTVLWGLGAYTLCLLPLIGLWKIESPLGYALLFFAMGFFNTFGIGIYPHLKDLFPTTISGTVMTLINFFTMTGAALLMPAIGKIIESFRRVDQSYPAEAFHLSFWICFVGMVGSLLFYAFSKQKSFDDDRPEDIRGSRGLG
jgi:MFS family permease